MKIKMTFFVVLQYQISSRSVYPFPRCFIHMDGAILITDVPQVKTGELTGSAATGLTVVTNSVVLLTPIHD
jgi:hypothetical protein